MNELVWQRSSSSSGAHASEREYDVGGCVQSNKIVALHLEISYCQSEVA